MCQLNTLGRPSSKAGELTGGKPFRDIDDLISQAELRKISENYARIAGFSREAISPL
jgi:hypothetical protein